MDKTKIWSFLAVSIVLISGCAGTQPSSVPTVQPSTETPLPSDTPFPTMTSTALPRTPTLRATFTSLPPTPSFTPNPTDTPDPFALVGECPNGESKQGGVSLVIRNNSGSDIYIRLLGRNSMSCYLLSIPVGMNENMTTITFKVPVDTYQRTTWMCGNKAEGTIVIDGNITLTFTPCSN